MGYWNPTDLSSSPAPPSILLDWDSTLTEVSGAASQWNDRSGNAYHFSQATTSSRPAVRTSGLGSLRHLAFNGSNSSLITSATAVLDLARATGAVWAFSICRNRKTSGDSPILWLARGTDSGARFLAGYSDGATTAGGRRLDGDSYAGVVGSASTAWRADYFHLNYSDRSAALQRDGTADGTQTGMWSGAGTTSNTRSTSPACIGRSVSAAAHADMDLAALIVGRGALPSQESIDRLFGWAAWSAKRAGAADLLDTLPSAHPYRHFAPASGVLFGSVRDSAGAPAQRRVTVLRESDGSFVASVLSNATTGDWYVETPHDDEHIIVFSGETDKNALVWRGVIPD